MAGKSRMNDELKSRLFEAHSVEEAAELLKEAGADETTAEQVWKDISSHREDKEFSLEELETVSGGADRDWLTDGCAATVEPGSDCWSNDACGKFDVVYDNPPSNLICPVCGTNLHVVDVIYATNPADDIVCYRCRKCGYATKA